MSTDCPMTAGAPPYRRRQRRSLRITTGGASAVSSFALNTRPICGAMPSSGISEAVVRAPRTRSGSLSPPVSVKLPLAISDTLPKLCALRHAGVVGRRRFELEHAVFRKRLPDEDQPIRIEIWQGLQQHAIDDREHCAVHPEGERQRRRHDEGKTWTAKEGAARIPQIAPPRIQVHGNLDGCAAARFAKRGS